MIVLKHLAREFDIDPYRLRQLLRKEFGKQGRWQWPDDSDPMYIRIHSFLKITVGSSD